MATLYEQFHHLRVVRRSEILTWLNGQVEKTNNAIKWLLKSGKAQRIKTGLYYFRRPDEWYQKDVLVSPWIIASCAAAGSVVAYHSALHIRGDAYSATKWIQIAINRGRKKPPPRFEYQNAEYRYYKDNTSFGVEEIIIQDLRVKTFTRERILLDGLAKPDRFFGLTEFLQSIDGYKWINPDKLFEYLPNYPALAVRMRLGWLLERFQKKWYIKDETLEQLQKDRPDDMVFLVGNKRRGNKRIRKWNLLVPKTLDYLDEV